MRNTLNLELGAVQARANLAQLEKCCKMSLQLQKSCFDTAENRPSKVCVTGMPVYPGTSQALPGRASSAAPFPLGLAAGDCATGGLASSFTTISAELEP